MGSRTFRDMMGYGPSSSEPFAAPMNEIPKIAFSRTRVPDTDHVSSTTRALEEATRVKLAQGSNSGSSVSSGAVSWTEAPVARPLDLTVLSTTRFGAGAVAHFYRSA